MRALRTADGVAIGELRSARLLDGSRVDITITGDTVTSINPAVGGTDVGGSHVLDLDGYLVMTAPAEPHAHLDKALSWDEISPPMGDLGSAIAAWRDYSVHVTVEEIASRARRAALTMLKNGCTAVRSHVDLLRGGDPLRGVKALVRVRTELAQVMDIELVALTPFDVGDDVVEAALDLGVDLVGGSSHHTPDPSADLQRLLAIAARRGVGVDMHIDEQLNPSMLTLEELALAVRDWPSTMPVTAGHCVSLGVVEPDVLRRVIAAVLEGNVAIVTLPITNLYLQGWDHPVATPRGLTAVRALLDAGVRVAAGADNVRDPFNPVGRSDALETAMLLVTAAHLNTREAYRAVSDSARDVMSLPPAGPRVGARAELLAIKADSLEEAIADAPADRYVLHRGRLVAAGHTATSVHLSSTHTQSSIREM
ncbi:amidohydrolase family protein [Actinomycetes bacterium M1A6_2h]